MAKIVRITKQTKTFEFEGEVYGIRPSTIGEQERIATFMAGYTRSVKDEVKADVADSIDGKTFQTGDLKLLMECQKFIVQTLCVDPSTNEQIFGNGSENNINEIPYDFIAAAWDCYNTNDQRRYLAKNLVDVFGSEWTDRFALVDRIDVDQQLSYLMNNGKVSEAHAAKVKLDLVKPVKRDEMGEQKPADPPTPAKTAGFGEAATT